MLLHLVDVTADDPVAAYRIVRKELKAYAEELAAKPEIIALNKVDLVGEEELAEKLAAFKKRVRKTPLAISGATGQGVDDGDEEAPRNHPEDPQGRCAGGRGRDGRGRLEAMSQRLAKARRIVVKIGSALLVDGATGTVKSPWLAALVDDLAALRAPRGRRSSSFRRAPSRSAAARWASRMAI